VARQVVGVGPGEQPASSLADAQSTPLLIAMDDVGKSTAADCA
jgi:hypothetical protein